MALSGVERRHARRHAFAVVDGPGILHGFSSANVHRFAPFQFVRTFVVAAILAITCGAAAGDPLLRVYTIRGLRGGGIRGMNQLCDELAKFPQVVCTVEDYDKAAEVEIRASASVAAGQRLVLVGHSWGAHAVLRIATAMKANIPLIVTVDPNWFPTPPTVPQNVEIALNYYQEFDVLGRAQSCNRLPTSAENSINSAATNPTS